MLEMWHSARSQQTPRGTQPESINALEACLCLCLAGCDALELLNKINRATC